MSETAPPKTIAFATAMPASTCASNWGGFWSGTANSLTISDFCEGPSKIGSDAQSFSVSESGGDCGSQERR